MNLKKDWYLMLEKCFSSSSSGQKNEGRELGKRNMVGGSEKNW